MSFTPPNLKMKSVAAYNQDHRQQGYQDRASAHPSQQLSLTSDTHLSIWH
jgi:hypothetical protein